MNFKECFYLKRMATESEDVMNQKQGLRTAIKALQHAFAYVLPGAHLIQC